MKICKKCGLEYSDDMFRKYLVKGKYYIRTECKECEKLYKRQNTNYQEQYRKRNEKEPGYVNKYYKSEKLSEYYLKNRERILERCKEYNKKHWNETLLRGRIYHHNRRLKINNTDDKSINKKSIEQLLIKQNYKCAITGDNLLIDGKLLYHIDHIYPLSKGGPHIISNIQLTTPEANIRKGNKIFII